MIDPFYPYFLPRLVPVVRAPQPQQNWALFLDLVGTLVDFAPTPDVIDVPEDLVTSLKAASQALDGALAIVSDRMLPEIDRFLSPLKLPASGEHGALIRMPDGSHDEIDLRIPYGWVQELMDATEDMSGVVIERKTHGVVAHYRNAPRFEKNLKALVSGLIANATAFEIVEARMSFEIHPRTVSTARAVNRLMTTEPFAGRTPVFVGDDVADLSGITAVERLGGFGLSVSDHFAGRPAEVRDWLKGFAIDRVSAA